ncbi:MAG TPA: trehalose-6-phosphate synthase, partial [Tepidiformaceae bacterium]|nr:trehalose-6-phosphate synthase [Tepidiformaceae bacterium]
MPPSLDLILANRAYLDHEAPRWADSPSAAGSGGVIQPWDGAHGTTWIGAGLGRYDREWVDSNGAEILATPRGPLRHRRLFFSNATWRGHYGEVSNSFLWPLFHLVRADLPLVTGYYPAPAAPSKADWDAYLAVNTTFAEAAAEASNAELCWVHDYQLTLVPGLLRARGFGGKIAYFLHTPFPSISVADPYLRGEAGERFRSVVEGILGSDLAGFQSPPDCERFIEAAVAYGGATARYGGVVVDGRFVHDEGDDGCL